MSLRKRKIGRDTLRRPSRRGFPVGIGGKRTVSKRKKLKKQLTAYIEHSPDGKTSTVYFRGQSRTFTWPGELPESIREQEIDEWVKRQGARYVLDSKTGVLSRLNGKMRFE